VAAAQEERFTRKKHDAGASRETPSSTACEAGITPRDLDYVAFYDKPLLKFERCSRPTSPRAARLALVPDGDAAVAEGEAVPEDASIERRRRRASRGKVLFTEHHESHAASAFFPSPFEEAAVLTDGRRRRVGDHVDRRRPGNELEMLKEMHFPHSLGLLYSAFTYYTGFKVNSGEYKVMGLAPYGEPKYADLILDKLIDLKEDGSFRLNMEYFDYCTGLTMTNAKFDELFGGPPRASPRVELTQREMDLAPRSRRSPRRSMLRLARTRARDREKNLCLAGGVALNCVANGKHAARGPFETSGSSRRRATPAARWARRSVWHQYLGQAARVQRRRDGMRGSYLGPRVSRDDEIEKRSSRPARLTERLTDARLDRPTVARLLAEEKAVGWFQGRMEFGPRALGAARSSATRARPRCSR
jgi:carbamoyltransferase